MTATLVKPPADAARPLFPHASGKFAKKVNGKLKYFGRWDDPAAALAEYERFLAAASHDTVTCKGLTVKDACNRFLTAKEDQITRGELSRSMFAEYRRTCETVADYFGRTSIVESLRPANFAGLRSHLAEGRSIISQGNEITKTRVLFKWCYDSRLIETPLHFGPDFKRPSRKLLRQHRSQCGKKLFTAAEILRLLDESGVHLRAMVLLGINCGFGNTDCASLPLSALDLDAGMVRYPRPKTAIDRECPLWLETVAALRASLARRPEPGPDATKRVFVQYDGKPFEQSAKTITKQVRQAILRGGMRRGGFYWLRHTFATVGGGSKDQIAVNAIMGHADHSMAAQYREEIGLERLRAVSEHVRAWLFGAGQTGSQIGQL